MAESPETLIVGDGPFALALALILNAGHIGFESLMAAPAPLASGAFPLVLDSLQRVFLVAGTHHCIADLLTARAGVWGWVERLSVEREYHPVAVIFVLRPETGEGFISSLALALGLDEFDQPSSGHSVVRMGDPLKKMLTTADRTARRDAVTHQSRLKADRRYRALMRLRTVGVDDTGDSESMRIVAASVLEVFFEREYDLDLFCCPPSHPNGNVVRKLLNKAVTGSVTQEEWEELLEKLSGS